MRNAFNNEVLESFSQINKNIFRLAKSDAEKIGITVVQLNALYKISACPNIGLSELADKLKLTNSTVSGVVDRLVQSDFVERITPPQDRRAITLNLTEKGNEKLKQMFSTDSELVTRLNEIQQLPQEDIQHLLNIHNQILNILTR